MITKNSIVHDQWLSRIFQRDVYKIVIDNIFVNKGNIKNCETYNNIVELQNSPVFLYSKVPVGYLEVINVLGNFNFSLIDTNITFEKPATQEDTFVGNSQIRFAFSTDQDQVVNLARKSFIFTRFHLDLAITNTKANEVKGEWVRNFFHGNRGDQMVVALVDKKIVGFAQLLHGKDKTLIIDQIAVGEIHRGKGIAKDMITYAEKECHEFQKIRVGTQLVNIPSINLYENLGFRMSGAQYVFHYHSNNA